MKRLLKLFAILLGALLALILVSVAAVYAITGSRWAGPTTCLPRR